MWPSFLTFPFPSWSWWWFSPVVQPLNSIDWLNLRLVWRWNCLFSNCPAVCSPDGKSWRNCWRNSSIEHRQLGDRVGRRRRKSQQTWRWSTCSWWKDGWDEIFFHKYRSRFVRKLSEIDSEATTTAEPLSNGWSTPNGLGWLAALGSYLYIFYCSSGWDSGEASLKRKNRRQPPKLHRHPIQHPLERGAGCL